MEEDEILDQITIDGKVMIYEPAPGGPREPQENPEESDSED